MFSTTMYPKLKTTHQITHHAILNLRYVEIVKNPCCLRVMTILIKPIVIILMEKEIFN